MTDIISPPSPRSPGRLSGRLALITGASRGIGRAVALRFAAEGAELVLVARTQAALEELDDELRQLGSRAILVPGDLTDADLIERMSIAVSERWQRLDVLVGNAAQLGVLSPLGHVPADTWQAVFALNVTANWRLLRSFDPLLRASPAGRALFVTDIVSAGRAYWSPYAASKAALESMVRGYAEEVERITPVRTNLLRPGPTRTALRSLAFPGENPLLLRAPDSVTETFVALAEAGDQPSGQIIDV